LINCTIRFLLQLVNPLVTNHIFVSKTRQRDQVPLARSASNSAPVDALQLGSETV
jgi:hypothetical protein